MAAIIDAETHRAHRQPELEPNLQALVRDVADLASAIERT